MSSLVLVIRPIYNLHCVNIVYTQMNIFSICDFWFLVVTSLVIKECTLCSVCVCVASWKIRRFDHFNGTKALGHPSQEEQETRDKKT